MTEKQALETSQGKLDKTSQRFRKLFLLNLTLEMIRHSKIEEFFLLENILKIKDRKEKQEAKNLEKKYGRHKGYNLSLMHREPFKRKEMISGPKPMFAPIVRPSRPIRRQMQPLRIPEYPLPQTVQNIRPIPSNIQLDLGKLNPLIRDQNVRAIECNGPDENIIAKGNIGAKTTNIILNKEEINQVLQKFSESSRIPMHEGVFKIVVGRLILSAIVSEVVGSKFIIRKMEMQMPPSSQGVNPNMQGPPLGMQRSIDPRRF